MAYANTSLADEDIFLDKVYCANCIHCKLVKIAVNDGSQYYLRVRCNAGKWKKKLGEEKFYKYFTVARRSLENCESYEPMGDLKDFLRDLKKSLPIKDEIYTF
ncbi:MAG: hypothetical protein JW904_03145 [Spirochaetales bacterium]|nr:hypothetical protein [Spirochaetales bacterium]